MSQGSRLNVWYVMEIWRFPTNSQELHGFERRYVKLMTSSKHQLNSWPAKVVSRRRYCWKQSALDCAVPPLKKLFLSFDKERWRLEEEPTWTQPQTSKQICSNWFITRDIEKPLLVYIWNNQYIATAVKKLWDILWQNNLQKDIILNLVRTNVPLLVVTLKFLTIDFYLFGLSWMFAHLWAYHSSPLCLTQFFLSQ